MVGANFEIYEEVCLRDLKFYYFHVNIIFINFYCPLRPYVGL